MATVKCPVCTGCEVDTVNAKHTATYKATIYYFCEENCKSKFLQDPNRYVNQQSH